MTNPVFGGTSSSYWKDENTYVGYYECISNSRYPCPQESQFPGWKKISEKGVSGSYGQCPTCAVTEIIWGRIDIAPGTPIPAPVKKIVKFSSSTYTKNGDQNYRFGWTIDGVYKEYGTTTVDNINKNYSGSVDKYLYENGIQYGSFSATDTIYGVNGSLYNPITSPVVPPVVTGCTEGTTRTAICPKNGKLITQNCIGNAWITIKADETKCSSGGGIGLSNTIIILIIVILIFYMITRR
jgi:hypothetical protein